MVGTITLVFIKDTSKKVTNNIFGGIFSTPEKAKDVVDEFNKNNSDYNKEAYFCQAFALIDDKFILETII